MCGGVSLHSAVLQQGWVGRWTQDCVVTHVTQWDGEIQVLLPALTWVVVSAAPWSVQPLAEAGGQAWLRGTGGSGGAVWALLAAGWGVLGALVVWCVLGMEESPGMGCPTQTMPLKPWIPHFLPAIWQPKVRASCRLFPGEQTPCQLHEAMLGHAMPSYAMAMLCLCPPAESAKMTEALKVSPAPSVSTRVSGGKASECTSSPLGPMASAPFSAQAQISVALGGG